MDSLTELAKKGEKYDFVFIDADKVDYCDYFNVSLLTCSCIIFKSRGRFGNIVVQN
jgi:predicted O-methyltransferase YrrM